MKIHKSITLLAAICCSALAVQSLSAQSRKGARRSNPTKKELEKRYESLRDTLPEIHSAGRDSNPDEREEVKRRAFSVVDKALNKELDNEISIEQERLKSSASDLKLHISDSNTSLQNAKEILPRAEAKRFDAMPKEMLVSAFSGQDTVTGGAKEPDFDGLTAVTADGETINVPGIDVAKSFDGSAVPVQGNGPEPGAKPTPNVPRKPKNAPAVTEITCTGEAVFSSTGSENEVPEGAAKSPPIVIFKENVHVKHPEFTIDCDRLIAYMKGDGAPGGAAAGDEGGIERVIATGREVTVLKKMANGKVKIGKARKLTYDATTGDVVLEDWPQVQDGDNVQMAAEKGVVMVIKKDGRMVAKGPTKAVIVPKTGTGDDAAGNE